MTYCFAHHFTKVVKITLVQTVDQIDKYELLLPKCMSWNVSLEELFFSQSLNIFAGTIFTLWRAFRAFLKYNAISFQSILIRFLNLEKEKIVFFCFFFIFFFLLSKNPNITFQFNVRKIEAKCEFIFFRKKILEHFLSISMHHCALLALRNL